MMWESCGPSMTSIGQFGKELHIWYQYQCGTSLKCFAICMLERCFELEGWRDKKYCG
jgi:hypothetical protein